MTISVTQAEEARRNIAPIAFRTPIVLCNVDGPPRLYLKLENLQPIGSFKIRGAANVIAHTPQEQLSRGLLTASAGTWHRALHSAHNGSEFQPPLLLPILPLRQRLARSSVWEGG